MRTAKHESLSAAANQIVELMYNMHVQPWKLRHMVSTVDNHGFCKAQNRRCAER